MNSFRDMALHSRVPAVGIEFPLSGEKVSSLYWYDNIIKSQVCTDVMTVSCRWWWKFQANVSKSLANNEQYRMVYEKVYCHFYFCIYFECEYVLVENLSCSAWFCLLSEPSLVKVTSKLHFIMYLCLYHPENGRDTDNVIKWTLSPCYWSLFIG